MAKAKKRKKGLVWKIVGISLAAVVALGIVFHIVNKDDKKEVNTLFGYEVGALSASGEEEKSETSIRTKKLISTDGFDVTVDEDGESTYQVFFYNEDKEFISASEPALDIDFDETTIPEDAKYARVVVTPEDDDKISWYEIAGYANDIEVLYNK